MSKPTKSLPFEQALEKLESIIKKLEEGHLSLDESLKMFEEGMGLTQLCQQKLNYAQSKVETILKNQEDLTSSASDNEESGV